MNAVRSEWIKLRTLLANKIMWAVALAFPVTVSVLTGAFSNGTFDPREAADLITGVTVVSTLVFSVMAVVSITGEYAHGTIRPTFAAQPRRVGPLIAKTLVVLVLALATTVVALALCWLLFTNIANGIPELDGSWPFWSVNGQRLLMPAMFAGLLVYAAGQVLVGIGVGMLIRNVGGAVAVVLLWPWLVEGLIGTLLENVFDSDDVVKFLPMQQGFSLFLSDREEFLTSRVGAGVYFMIWMLVVYALGVVRTVRSDA